MRKNVPKILCVPLLIFSGVALASSKPFYFKELIQERKYHELREALVAKKPDVLSRDEGLSVFDYALKRKDKRASVIIADYHNKVAQSDELRDFYSQLDSVKDSLRSEETGKIESAIQKTLAVLREVREKTEVLQAIQSRDTQEIKARIEEIDDGKVNADDLVKIVQYFDANRVKVMLDLEAMNVQQEGNLAEMVQRLEASDAALLSQLEMLKNGQVTKEDVDKFITSSVYFETGE